MNERPRDFFLSEGPLRPGDAAVALILLDDLRYLMQLRDQKPGIFYPGHWGLFGGGIEPGESAEDGLRRELFEELGLEAESVSYFTRFSFDFSCCGARPVERHYYEVRVAAPKLRTMTLGEGSRDVRFHRSGDSCEGECDALRRLRDLDAFDAGGASEQSRAGNTGGVRIAASSFAGDLKAEWLA